MLQTEMMTAAVSPAARASAVPSAAADVRVLGRVGIASGGETVGLSAKQQRLLAALLVAAGRACDVDELVEVVWSGAPPRSARDLIRVYVSQIRKSLPEGASIVTRGGAYALELEEQCLDALRFERLLEEATAARDDENVALAAALADRALALWHGRAYGDLAFDDFARVESERLEELRLAARELHLDAELALGRHEERCGEALHLAEESPFREHVHELAMLALYRCGRQTEALEHYAAVRARLSEELGLEPGPALRELQRRILQHDPALTVSGGPARAGAVLPVPPTPLVARTRELDELRNLVELREARLIVLTGAGGSGKTRLAYEAAARSAAAFANGVALVELAPVRDPALVPAAIAQAVGVAEDATEDAVTAALAAQELLLVVDNAEHVREAAPFLARLVARSSRLTLLVTSRAVLHASGERVFAVPPLEEDGAVELFVQRAHSLQSSFQRTAENEADLRAICRRLDGLPLAIELAAARIRMLTPRALLERLDRRLTLLVGGPRDLPARQQTLRETIDWSVGLLSENERRALGRLAVFPGGATLDAAEAVCGVELDTLEALVDHSLVRRVETGSEPRFGLLETMREYALELLGDERVAVEQRFAGHFAALAQEAEPHLSGEQQTFWLAVLEDEQENIDAAHSHLAGDADARLRLAIALSRFWYIRGYLGEGRRRLAEALAESDASDRDLRRRALTAGASLALLQGDYPDATAFAEEALAVARAHGIQSHTANALSNLGAIVLAGGDHRRAETLLEEAVRLARGGDDQRIAALAINNLGDLALTVGDYERAEPLFEESLALIRARGDTANVSRSLFNLGAVALRLGRLDAAEAHLHESLGFAVEAGDKEDIAWCLEGFAGLAAAEGDGERAALLLGAAEALLEEMGADFKPFERALHEQTSAEARRLAGSEAFAESIRQGAAMARREVLETAVASIAQPQLYEN